MFFITKKQQKAVLWNCSFGTKENLDLLNEASILNSWQENEILSMVNQMEIMT